MAEEHIVVNAVGIRGGGGWAVTRDLVNALAEARPDWRFTVCLYSLAIEAGQEYPYPSNVTIHRPATTAGWQDRLRWLNQGLPALAREIHCTGYLDLTNIFSPNMPCAGVLMVHNPFILLTCWQVAKLRRGKVSMWLTYIQMILAHRYLRKSVAVARFAVVQTETMRDQCARLVGRHAHKIQIVPSGYSPAAPDWTKVRPDLQKVLEADNTRVCYIANPNTYKNHKALIQALPGIRQDIPDVKLVLTLDPAHPTDTYYRTYIQELQQEIKRLGVGAQVHLAGQLAPAEVAVLLSRSAAMIFPSLYESFGLPQVEAMAANCPVLASDLPYAHQVCGPAAEFFDPRSPESIAQRTVDLLKKPARMEQLRQAGRDRSTEFSYPFIAGKFATLLEQAIAEAASTMG